MGMTNPNFAELQSPRCIAVIELEQARSAFGEPTANFMRVSEQR